MNRQLAAAWCSAASATLNEAARLFDAGEDERALEKIEAAEQAIRRARAEAPGGAQ